MDPERGGLVIHVVHVPECWYALPMTIDLDALGVPLWHRDV